MLKYLAIALTFVAALSSAEAQEGSAMPRIVVAGFANKTGDKELDWVGFGIHASLTRRLLRHNGLVVMDAANFRRVKNELGLKQKEVSDPKEAAKIGRAFGAHKVLVGSYRKAPTGVKVELRLVDSETGKSLEPVLSQTGPAVSVTAELALDAAKALGKKAANHEAITKNLTDSPNAYEKYCKGLQFRETEETFDKAIELFLAAAKADKAFAAPHFELGWLFTFTGIGAGNENEMYRAAVKEYEKAVKLYPEYAEAYNNLGVVYTQLEKQQEAMSACLKATKIIPNYIDAHYNLGRLYDLREKYDKAIAEYRKTVELSPRDAIAYNNLAVALLNKGDNDEALEAYLQALKIMPDLKEAHLGLGLIYDSKGNKRRALRHYKKFFDLGGYDEDIKARMEQLRKELE